MSQFRRMRLVDPRNYQTPVLVEDTLFGGRFDVRLAVYDDEGLIVNGRKYKGRRSPEPLEREP